ncbi:unnamed protein product [Mucor hiemalis]
MDVDSFSLLYTGQVKNGFTSSIISSRTLFFFPPDVCTQHMILPKLRLQEITGRINQRHTTKFNDGTVFSKGQGNFMKNVKRKLERYQQSKLEGLKVAQPNQHTLSEEEENDGTENKKKSSGLKCNNFKRFFKTKNTLEKHKKTHLPEEKRKCHLCAICNENFLSKEERKLHMITHVPEEKRISHNCPECDKEFQSKFNLCRHRRTHIPNEERIKHRCHLCNRAFARSSTLKIHMKTHLPDAERERFSCDKCPVRFKTKAFYWRHKSITHIPEDMKQPKVGCEICPKKFDLVSQLKLHQKTHLPDSEKQWYHCELCKNVYRSKASLQVHNEVKHMPADQKPEYKCKVCNKVYQYHDTLKKHENSHLPEDQQIKYECSVCKKKLSYKKTLKDHMQTHLPNSERIKYECDICGGMFSYKTALYEHKVNVHNMPKARSIQ